MLFFLLIARIRHVIDHLAFATHCAVDHHGQKREASFHVSITVQGSVGSDVARPGIKLIYGQALLCLDDCSSADSVQHQFVPDHFLRLQALFFFGAGRGCG